MQTTRGKTPALEMTCEDVLATRKNREFRLYTYARTHLHVYILEIKLLGAHVQETEPVETRKSGNKSSLAIRRQSPHDATPGRA